MKVIKTRSLEDKVTRLEILQGLAAPPKWWHITPDRVKNLAGVTGVSLQTARKMLVTNYGDKLPEEGA